MLQKSTCVILIFLIFAIFAGALRAGAQGSLSEGVQLFENGRFAEAKKFFASFVATNPEHAVASYYLGRVAFNEENYDEAVTWFEKAVQRDDGNAAYHLWLGRAYGHKAMSAYVWEQFFLARKVKVHFERAVALDPDNVAARWDLMEYYLKAPRFLGGSQEKASLQAAEIHKRDAREGDKARRMIAEAEGKSWHEEEAWTQ